MKKIFILLEERFYNTDTNVSNLKVIKLIESKFTLIVINLFYFEILFQKEDGSPYSQFDTLSMLQATGLCNKEACDWLLQLHRILQEQLMGSEQPCIGDLLKTGSLVQMQFKRGINMLAALTQATESVYVRSVQNAATRKVSYNCYEFLFS